MSKNTTSARQGKSCPVLPIYRIGDEIVFKFEGNLRARVEGYEVIDGRVRLDCRAYLGFLVPYSQVVSVEREE